MRSCVVVVTTLECRYAAVRHVRQEGFHVSTFEKMVVLRGLSARNRKSIVVRVRMTDHEAKRPKTTQLATVWQAFWPVGTRDDMRNLCCWRMLQMRVGKPWSRLSHARPIDASSKTVC